MSKRHRRAAARAAGIIKGRQGATGPTTMPVSQPGGVGGMGGLFAYDAANPFSQESAEWQPWLRSPDSEINYDRDRMVARSRDLSRNDGWASGAKMRIADSAIGSRFRLVSKPDYRALSRLNPAFDSGWADEFGRAAEAEWRMWAEDPNKHCDAGRRLTVTQMFRMAFTHKMVDGDALLMLLWAPESVGLGAARYATTLQVIDPDRLSNPFQQLDTKYLRGGVEVDDLGAPVAYHIRRGHQGDWYGAIDSMTWDRIPKETPWGRPIVVHDFDADRATQHRGVGIFTPILNRFRMLARYDQAELQQALLQTIFATFIQSPYDPADVQSSMEEGEVSEYQALRQDWHDKHPISLGGVRIPVLPPGEEPKTVSASHPNSGFDAFQSTFLRNVAAATGQSAEQVSWDYSKTNYSSARAAMLEAWRTLIRRRDDFASGVANPVYGGFLEEAMAEGRLPLPKAGKVPSFIEMRAAFMGCRWIGPARGWVDPVAERQGAVLGLDAAFGTLEQECAEQGLDYEEVLDQREVEVKLMKEKGLPMPTWAVGAQVGAIGAKPPAATPSAPSAT